MSYDEKTSLQVALEQWNKNDCGLDAKVIDAFSKRKVIFFLGAGVSRLEGVMGWDDFSNELVKKTFPNLADQEQILKGGFSSKEKISMAYEQYDKNNIKDFYEIFENALTPPKDFKSLGIYEILAKFKINFLTTNADLLFENVLGKEFCYTKYDGTTLFKTDYTLRNQLFYLHGRISDNYEELVFTSSQYVKRYNDLVFREFLKSVFNDDECVVFFIGYGLNEYELIDYMLSKVGVYNENNPRLYILEPYFSSQDTLFKARKAYFKSLNIKVLPYCKDEGYGELKHILKKLQDFFELQAFVPHEDYQDIKYLICNKYTKYVKAQIDHILQENMNDDRFRVVCEKIKESDYWNDWGKEIINDELWYPSCILDNYLSLNKVVGDRVDLLCWFIGRSIDVSYIRKATEILDCIINVNDESLKKIPISLIAGYIDMICLLTNKDFNDKYFCFISRSFKLFGSNLCYRGMIKGGKLLKWKRSRIEKFILCVLNGICCIDNILFGEERNYINYFEKNNEVVFNQKISKAFFNAYYTYVKNIIENEYYGPVNYKKNLDNVEKSHYTGWSSILKLLIKYFNLLDNKTQDKYLKIGLASNNGITCKLWIYILRKTKADLSYVLHNWSKCSTYQCCIVELYLLIKNSEFVDYKENLETKIKEAKFGLDKFKGDEQYLVKIRNGFLQAIGCDIAGETYDIEDMANRGDIVISREIVRRSNVDIGYKELICKLAKEKQEYLKINLAEYIINVFISLSNSELNEFIYEINSLDDDKLNYIILQARIKNDKMSDIQKHTILKYVLEIITSERYNELLFKNCFDFLGRMDLAELYKEESSLFYVCWEKWRDRCLKDVSKSNYSYGFANDLINTAEYARISFFCNYWVTRYNIGKQKINSEEFRFIQQNAKTEITRYCLSYRFWFVGMVAENVDMVNELINKLVFVKNDDRCDEKAVVLIVNSMETINSEVDDLILKTKLLEKKSVLKKLDEVLVCGLYRYVSAAYFCGKLKITDMEHSLNEQKMYEAIALCIYQGTGKGKKENIKLLKTELWPQIYKKLKKDDTLIDSLMRFIKGIIFENIDDVELIKILNEIVCLCRDGKQEIIVEADKLIKIYKKHPEEGKLLIKNVFQKSCYIGSSIYEIEKIIKHLVTCDEDFANDLVVQLQRCNQVPFDEKERLYQIVKKS